MAGSWQPPAAFNVVSTLAVLAAAVALSWLAWNYYEYSPWTRDGRVRVYTVQVAPEVSGTVVDLSIKDNQFVRKGDVLFRIDPETYQNAVKQAEGKLAQARAQAGYLVDEAKRRRALPDLAVSREQQENATGVAQAANDANPGVVVTGHVSGLGRGIDVPNAAPGVQGLPSVNPVFTWVRLAQRVPVRVELDDVPCPVVLSSGLTATVTVTDGRAGIRAHGPGRIGSDAGQGCAEPRR